MLKNLLNLYKDRINAGVLHEDAAQSIAVGVLDDLYGRLLKPTPFAFLKLKAKPLRGVYLYGGVGRGKSMLMDLFFSSLPAHVKKRRIHFHAFMIDVHDFMHSHRQSEGKGKGVDVALPLFAKHIARQVRVLCFDEFHVSDVADAMILGRLFTELFKSGVIVVATSNWEPDNLYEGGLQRDLFLPFIDLLKERMEIVHVNGEHDYRGDCLEEEGTYFYPLGVQTTKRIESIFSHITDHAPPYSEDIEVKGRTIKVDKVANWTARFRFEQLCEQALGAEDYLKIAQRYRVVFLEDVPALKDAQRNEAKRLMILIDALYDCRTKLVVSAQVLPEGIYTGSDHGFEFGRTISRLREMGSKEYLKKSF